jgi:PHS family inorganic phosphate transporter-like MFS transporter
LQLNQSVVLAQIGYSGKGEDIWGQLYALATGNVCATICQLSITEIDIRLQVIVTALGFLPGYYVTLFTIDIIGRKWLQFGGFLMAGLFLAILAGEINHIGKGPLVAVFTFLQFFFNFGANTTTCEFTIF